MLEDLKFITPEIILSGFAFFVLMAGVLIKQKDLLGFFAFLGIACAVLTVPNTFFAGPFLFSGMLVNDPLSVFFREIILFIIGVVILISMGFKGLDEEDKGEFYFLILIFTAAMMFAVSSNNLIMLYLGVEAVSLISYISVGFLKRDILSAEGGLKYFLFGAVSTGVMLYGITFIYGLFGTTDLNAILTVLAGHPADNLAIVLPLILILVGIGFKCGVVPFHMWVPDAYQGAPTPITALLSVGPKAMGFALLMRVFSYGFAVFISHWGILIAAISVLSMTIGNILAISQNNIKRMLAFSSIAQAGYILLGIAVGTGLGLEAALFYIFVYTVMNLGAFGAVILISNSLKSDNIEDYAGLYRKDPFSAIVLTVSLLSLTGIPPLAGFLGKFFILSSVVQVDYINLAVIMVINSVLGLYYYVRVIKYMYLHESNRDLAEVGSLATKFALMLILALNVIIGIWPHPLLNWISALFNLS